MEPTQDDDTLWDVRFSGKAEKQVDKLPAEIRERVYALKLDLKFNGPEQRGWRNYGPIVGAKDVHHCHMNSGRPRYVVVWKVIDREIRIYRDTPRWASRQRELQSLQIGGES